MTTRIAATKTGHAGDTAKRQKTSHKKRCLECKASFTSRRSDAKYCSQSCRQKAARSRRSAADRRRRQPKRVETCVQCQEPFIAVGPKKQYCSQACRQEAYRQRRQQAIAELVRIGVEHHKSDPEQVKQFVRRWPLTKLTSALQRVGGRAAAI